MTRIPRARVVARVLAEVIRDAEAVGDLRVSVSIYLLRDALAHLRTIPSGTNQPTSLEQLRPVATEAGAH